VKGWGDWRTGQASLCIQHRCVLNTPRTIAVSPAPPPAPSWNCERNLVHGEGVIKRQGVVGTRLKSSRYHLLHHLIHLGIVKFNLAHGEGAIIWWEVVEFGGAAAEQ
jgi:hypothetical protein